MAHADGHEVTVKASPNLALVKYWGKENHDVNLPLNASLSLPLGDLMTRVTVWPTLSDDWEGDLSRFPQGTKIRILSFIQTVRTYYPKLSFVTGRSSANFPSGVGIASSASFYAALAKALLELVGVNEQSEIARMARLGSGSATRSIPSDSWVGWLPGSHEMSFGYALPKCDLPQNWKDVMWVFDAKHKKIESSIGHVMMDNSPLREARKHRANIRFVQMCRAIQKQDWIYVSQLVIEETLDFVSLIDTHTINPYLNEPADQALRKLISFFHAQPELRPWMVSIDAGATIHIIGKSDVVDQVEAACVAHPVMKLTSKICGHCSQEVESSERLPVVPLPEERPSVSLH